MTALAITAAGAGVLAVALVLQEWRRPVRVVCDVTDVVADLHATVPGLRALDRLERDVKAAQAAHAAGQTGELDLRRWAA